MTQENNIVDKLIQLKKYISDLIKIADIEIKESLKEKHRYQAFEITENQLNDLLTEIELDIINQQYEKI